MKPVTRFQAKREGADGAIVKDVKTDRTVATFPADPDHPGMARRFAAAAATEFNRLHGERLAAVRRMGR